MAEQARATTSTSTSSVATQPTASVSGSTSSTTSTITSSTSQRKRRGPYLKWLATEPATSHLTSEPDEVFTAKVPKHFHYTTDQSGSDDDNETTEVHNSVHVDEDSDHVIDDEGSASFYDEYSPPMNDHEDDMLDQLLSDLQAKVQEECSVELAEDAQDPLNVLAEEVLQTAAYETLEAQKDTEDDTDDQDLPLYPGSKRHLGITMLLLCCFMIRFRLSDETVQYLLALLQLLLPDNNHLVRSLHGLKNYVGKFTFAPVIQYYCSHCYTHAGKDAKTCMNDRCMKDLTQSGSLSYFVQHSLISQLSVLFKRKSFTESIRSHRFDHFRSTKLGHLNDVYDGSLYQDLYHSGVLNNPNNISFSMSTDGVAIFKSSKISMWPVYMLVNELPLKQRKARENVLFYGIWVSSRKPCMWSFLQPLYKELKQLENGVTFSDHEGQQFKCQASLLTCTCDLPAKCLVSNSVQFNGKYGCWHCLQMGENFRTEKGGNAHVFPYNEDDPAGPVRTSESVKADVQQVIKNIQQGQRDYTVHGIKGPSWLMFLNSFDFINGFVIDYMHGVCGGVTKLLITLWFTATHKKQKFSCFASRERVTNILKKIKPTINITRVPRSLDDLAFWKASEYRNFLLYWGIPVLRKILKPVYFLHFCLFVRAIYLLSAESISPEDIAIAEACLFEFVKQFEQLYSRRFMTMNIHQIVHLPKTVRHNGPLFANNSFVFEDINGYIVSHLHGTQGVDTQIIQTINLIQAIPILYEQFAGDDPESVAFIERMNDTFHTLWERIQDGIYRVDVAKGNCIAQDEFLAMKQRYVDVSSGLVKCWFRIFIRSNSSYVYASRYKRLVKRNQSVVKYKDGEMCKFGSVQYFAEVPYATAHVNVAVILPYCLDMYNVKDHIHCVGSGADKIDIIELQHIVCPCLYVEANDEQYICEFPNRYERD